MNSKIVIADTGVIISLSSINCLSILEKLFGEYYIAQSVWIELNKYKTQLTSGDLNILETKVKIINEINYLSIIMDFGESESVILYKELCADFLLIDDKKARIIAESLSVNCIGTLGILAIAKEKGFIENLRSIFLLLLENKRFYSLSLLNRILLSFKEPIL